MKSSLKGILHGKTIELEREPGLPDGQEVTVDIQPILAERTAPDAAPWWLNHFEINPAVALGKLLIKGTKLQAEALLAFLDEGQTEEELLHRYSELKPADIAALREYARGVPQGLRRSLGAWAADAEALDEYLEWNRQQRQIGRAEMEP